MKILFKNAMVLRPSADGDFCVEKLDVKVVDDKISAVAENIAAEDGCRVIDCTDKLLMPGLVNAHTHAYMTLLRNCADDVPFTKWLFENVDPMEGRMQEGDAYWGCMLAQLEMLKTGTTSFLDMYIHTDENIKAVLDGGLRAVMSRGLVGSATDEGGQRRLKEAKTEMEKWKGQERISFMLAPHTPFTCEEDYLQLIANEALELGVGINIHIAEGADELRIIRERYNKTPVEFIESTGMFRNHTVAAHCIRLTESDMDILKRNNVYVATNPVSNMKLSNGFAHIPEMINKGVNICIGTDGAASNNTLNMFRELGILSLIHKGTHEDAVSVSAQEALRFATINGANALMLGNETGSIEVGKKADLILLDMKTPAFVPAHNPISALAYSVSGSEVETVMVDGKLLMEKRQLLTIDEERVYFEVNKRGKALRG